MTFLKKTDTRSEEQTQTTGLTRRGFALGCGSAAALLALGGTVKVVGSEALCRPPGGQDEDAFIAACIRCDKCLQICPTNVLVPAPLEKGLLNARTPTFNFKLGWCDYCKESHAGVPQCAKVCPTEALKLPEGAKPENVIMGKAYIVKEWCLAWRLKNCRICVDECPYDAIEFNNDGFPVVLLDKCNGCGLCENVCISMISTKIVNNATDRAITVKPTMTVDYLLAKESRSGGRS
ncbi:MAG: 4Fe-4S dicluster domain-containing protein [Eggerthellaceae bacterium]|jgi:ferredoxin-type protein NapG|nr:4Fe-4S dicluster domain-containing protein [Eggerthellaceae bacterium]MDR2721732.1 4Fe-4S dicluster domain-containing protein [Coriobacteriaceae bacterium]